MPEPQDNPDPGAQAAAGSLRIPDLPKPRKILRRVIVAYALGLVVVAGVGSFLLFQKPVNRLRVAKWADQATDLRKHGKLAEAEQEYRDLLAFKERTFGPDDSTVLDGRNNLATVLEDQKKHLEAEQEYRVAVAEYQRVLGAEHPDTLTCRKNLANTLLAQEKMPKPSRSIGRFSPSASACWGRTIHKPWRVGATSCAV